MLEVIAVILIIEGTMPALMPQAWRNTMNKIAQLPDSTLRTAGLVFCGIGALILAFIP